MHGALGRVSEGLIDVFAAAGTATDAVEALDRFRAAGLHEALAWHVLGPAPLEGLRLLSAETLVR